MPAGGPPPAGMDWSWRRIGFRSRISDPYRSCAFNLLEHKPAAAVAGRPRNQTGSTHTAGRRFSLSAPRRMVLCSARASGCFFFFFFFEGKCFLLLSILRSCSHEHFYLFFPVLSKAIEKGKFVFLRPRGTCGPRRESN